MQMYIITFTAVKCLILVSEKTKESYIENGIRDYVKRLEHYCPVEWLIKPGIKKPGTREQLLKSEGQWFIAHIQQQDFVIALDDKGMQFSSEELAQWIMQKQLSGKKRWVILIGSAYGFDTEVLKRCDSRLSLSRLTFTHQMVRLIFIEQWYRAHTIIKGESYHH